MLDSSARTHSLRASALCAALSLAASWHCATVARDQAGCGFPLALAVHMSGDWLGQPIALSAAAVLHDGNWIPLGKLLDQTAFRAADDHFTYPIAGALVDFLVARFGRENFLALYRAEEIEKSDDVNRAVFEKTIGISIDEADAQLRASLMHTP